MATNERLNTLISFLSRNERTKKFNRTRKTIVSTTIHCSRKLGTQDFIGGVEKRAEKITVNRSIQQSPLRLEKFSVSGISTRYNVISVENHERLFFSFFLKTNPPFASFDPSARVPLAYLN